MASLCFRSFLASHVLLFLVTAPHDVQLSLVFSTMVSKIQVCLLCRFPLLHLPPCERTRILPSSRISLLAVPARHFFHVHSHILSGIWALKLRFDALLCRGMISWRSRSGSLLNLRGRYPFFQAHAFFSGQLHSVL